MIMLYQMETVTDGKYKVGIIERDKRPIHPFSAAYPGQGRSGIKLSNVTQQHSSAPPGGFQGIPRPEGIQCLQLFLGLPRGLLPVRRAWRETSRRHPDQMPKPPKLTPLDAEEQRLLASPWCLSS